MRETVSIVAQSAAMLMYIVCLAGSLLSKHHDLLFYRILHLGSFVLWAAVVVVEGNIFSLSMLALLSIPASFANLDRLLGMMEMIPTKSSFLLREAIEVVLMMTITARRLFPGARAVLAAGALIPALWWLVTALIFVHSYVYAFITRYDGLPMLVLASIVVGSSAVFMLHAQPSIHLIGGLYLPLMDIVLLVAFLALSGTRRLYVAGLADSPKMTKTVVMLMPAVTMCAFTHLGELLPGVAFAVAEWLIMRGAGWSRRDVLTSVGVGAAAMVTFFLVHPYAARRWILPFFNAEYAHDRAQLRAAMLSGSLWWGSGVTHELSVEMTPRFTWDHGLAHTLSVYGLPGMVCMATVAFCTIAAGATSLVKGRDAGLMIPFLCFVWGVELVGFLAAAFGLVPTLSTHGLPFLGYCHPITVPLLEVPAFLIALFCDQLSAEIAEDEELAEKGTIVLRVADQEEGGE